MTSLNIKKSIFTELFEQSERKLLRKIFDFFRMNFKSSGTFCPTALVEHFKIKTIFAV